MFTIKVKDTEYKVRYGMNSFIDTDLMDRVQKILSMLQGKGMEDDSDVAAAGLLQDLFSVTRDLYFYGFKKYNPLESLEAVGDLLDDYADEGTEEDKRGILQLFMMVAEELLNEGFLADLMADMQDSQKVEKVAQIPQDHKKKKA